MMPVGVNRNSLTVVPYHETTFLSAGRNSLTPFEEHEDGRVLLSSINSAARGISKNSKGKRSLELFLMLGEKCDGQ